jgi:hypothetical protein
VNKFWVEGSKNCIVVAAESHHSLGEWALAVASMTGGYACCSVKLQLCNLVHPFW